MATLWQFWQGHPKPSFSEKVRRGDQRKFFKNRLKTSLRLKFSKAQGGPIAQKDALALKAQKHSRPNRIIL